MKKTNNEKTKKIAVIAGLVAVGVLAVTGILLCLYKEEPADYIAEEAEASSETIEVDTESVIPSIPSEKAEEEKELVISTETAGQQENTESGSVQALQKEPEKTENEKPSEPPAEVMNADTGNADTPPENKEIPAQTTPQTTDTTDTSDSQNGTVKDGKIYIDGFGWIDYNGGETDVVSGDGIYENGNTVGIMD